MISYNQVINTMRLLSEGAAHYRAYLNIVLNVNMQLLGCCMYNGVHYIIESELTFHCQCSSYKLLLLSMVRSDPYRFNQYKI